MDKPPPPTWRADRLLRGIALIALLVLMGGLIQTRAPALAASSWFDWLRRPIEINAAARLPRLPEADLHALWFFDKQEGLAVGESGTVLQTVDGGASWNRVTVNVPGDDRAGWYVLKFTSRGAPTDSPLVGYLGGENGIVLRTTDRGRSWSRPELVTSKVKEAPPTAETRSPAQMQKTAGNPPPPVPATQPSGGGNSSWPRSTIYDMAVSPDGRSLYLAGAQGLFLIPGDDKNAYLEIYPGLTRSVVVEREIVVAASAAGLKVQSYAAAQTKRDPEVSPGNYTAVASHDGLVFSAGDRFRFDNLDGSNHLEELRSSGEPKRIIHECQMLKRAGWAVGEGGAVWRVTVTSPASTGPAAMEVQRRDVPGFAGALYALWAFSEDELLVAGQNGAMFRTKDAGLSWAPLVKNCWPETDGRKTFNLSLPAPWCWLALGLCVAAGWWRWKRLPSTIKVKESVAEELASDRPLEPGEADRLGFGPFVQGLSAYLRNTATQAPLTLAVTGDWGAGKSSFMNLLRQDLNRHGLRTVWFNAWHHQQEPQILAPLLSAVQADVVPTLWSDQPELALRFRGRLLAQRMWRSRRQWLAVGLVVSAVVGLLVASRAEVDLPAWLDWMDGAAANPDDTLSGLIGEGSLIGTLLVALLLVWRALKTFGVNPADLLATAAGKTSAQALQAQTSFRREFATQFREVTEALEPYPLVIFIDDLDRCGSDNVFQILEAINYLVSNGPCFVVLGMRRELVRDCVAMSFHELPVDFGSDATVGKRAAPDEPATESDTWAAHRQLADDYLEKLIQLRIMVPRPNAVTVQGLMRSRAADYNKVGAEQRPGRASFWPRYGLPLIMAGLIGLAFWGGHWIAPRLQGKLSVATTVAPVLTGPATGSSTQQTGGGGGKSGDGLAAGPALFRERALASTVIQPGQGASAWTVALGFLGIGALIGAVWLAEKLWQRRLSVEIKDSPQFRRACEVWAQALHTQLGEKLTPRALKRFKNTVRFYAMMRGGDGGDAVASSLRQLDDASLVAIGAAEKLGFVKANGGLTRHSLDRERLKKSTLSDALKQAVIAAFELIEENVETEQAMQEVRRLVKA